MDGKEWLQTHFPERITKGRLYVFRQWTKERIRDVFAAECHDEMDDEDADQMQTATHELIVKSVAKLYDDVFSEITEETSFDDAVDMLIKFDQDRGMGNDIYFAYLRKEKNRGHDADGK